MDIWNKIITSLRIKREPPLTQPEIHLLSQLQNNRIACLEYVIPNDMKEGFLSSVYSDKGLKRIVKEVYRNRLVSENNR